MRTNGLFVQHITLASDDELNQDPLRVILVKCGYTGSLIIFMFTCTFDWRRVKRHFSLTVPGTKKTKKIYMTRSKVSTHVALDHQTYSALAQHTQITSAQLKCDKHYRVDRWSLGLHYIIILHTYGSYCVGRIVTQSMSYFLNLCDYSVPPWKPGIVL